MWSFVKWAKSIADDGLTMSWGFETVCALITVTSIELDSLQCINLCSAFYISHVELSAAQRTRPTAVETVLIGSSLLAMNIPRA
jgi:hypothetical protein